jgi:hypothetical protein
MHTPKVLLDAGLEQMSTTTLYGDSEALALELRPLLALLARVDQGLARKLKRASDELGEHVTEAMCTTGRERRDEYEAALVSARETLACLRAAESVRLLSNPEADLEGRLQRLMTRLVSARAA